MSFNLMSNGVKKEIFQRPPLTTSTVEQSSFGFYPSSRSPVSPRRQVQAPENLINTRQNVYQNVSKGTGRQRTPMQNQTSYDHSFFSKKDSYLKPKGALNADLEMQGKWLAIVDRKAALHGKGKSRNCKVNTFDVPPASTLKPPAMQAA